MDIIPQKLCPVCGETKPLSEFNRDRQCADGLQWRCRACNRARNRAYYEAHQAQTVQRTTAYRQAHPEMQKRAVRKWRERNAEQYSSANRARVAAWRETHRAEDSAAALRWAQENPDAKRAIQHRRRARKLGNGGSYTAAEWQALQAQHGYCCLCCGRSEPTIKLTADHVVPLTRGGSNAISNIQPLCFSCNCRKGTQSTDYRPHP